MTACAECKGRGWHIGECHPQEECGACLATGFTNPLDRIRALEGHRNKWRRVAGRLHDALKPFAESVAGVGKDGVTLHGITGEHLNAARMALNFDGEEVGE